MTRKTVLSSCFIMLCMVMANGFAAKRLPDYPQQPRTLLITVSQSDQSYRQHEYGSYHYRTQSKQDVSDQQQLRVLDGHQAYIDVGQSIPLPDNYYAGYYPTSGIRYKDVTSGFYVTPRLHGNKVTLTIDRKQERLDPHGQGRILVNRLSTTVVAPVGQWVKIGGTGKISQSNQQVTRYNTNQEKRFQSTTYIKVDVL